MAITYWDDARDQGLIFLCSQVPYFGSSIDDKDDFLERFMLMKPVTSEARFSFCSYLDPTEYALSCKSDFLKYCTRDYFGRPLSFYHYGLRPLSFEEVKIKEDLCAWYQGLGYE